MLTILGILISGVLLGYLLRGYIPLKWISKSISVFIYLLLLVLGIAVGSNDLIVNNLTTIGLKGGIIAVSAIIGSLIMAKLLSRVIKINNRDEG